MFEGKKRVSILILGCGWLAVVRGGNFDPFTLFIFYFDVVGCRGTVLVFAVFIAPPGNPFNSLGLLESEFNPSRIFGIGYPAMVVSEFTIVDLSQLVFGTASKVS